MTRETMLRLVDRTESNLSDSELRKLVDGFGYIEYHGEIINFLNLRNGLFDSELYLRAYSLNLDTCQSKLYTQELFNEYVRLHCELYGNDFLINPLTGKLYEDDYLFDPETSKLYIGE